MLNHLVLFNFMFLYGKWTRHWMVGPLGIWLYCLNVLRDMIGLGETVEPIGHVQIYMENDVMRGKV